MSRANISQAFLHWIRKSKIHIRLISVFLAISLIPSLALALFSNRVYSDSIEEKTAQASRQTLQLLNNNLQYILEEYSQHMNELSIAPNIHDFLLQRLQNPDFNQLSMIYNLEIFNSLFNNPYMKDVFIIDANGEFVINNGFVSYSPEAIDEILAATEKISPRDYVSYYIPSYGSDCISMCRKIYDNRFTNTHVGYIIIFFDTAVLEERVFPVSSLGEGSSIFLINSEGHMVASQNTEITADAEFIHSLRSYLDTNLSTNGYTEEIPDSDHLALYTFNKKYNLHLVTYIPNDFLNAEISRIHTLVIILTMILLILCLILSTLIYHSIVSPIKEMVAVCSRPKEDNAVSLIRDSAEDELGYLARTIDSKTLSNEQMMQELEIRDKQKRELEIEMLMCQINPHFLFNTLNTLKWMASINGVPSISEGLSSLANLLRNTLVKKEEMVTVQDEINSLKDYCTIQNLRYAGQFTISYFVDTLAQPCQIPKFILQPLVENSILHGSGNEDAILNIAVSCHVLDKMLYIMVQDNGVGFSMEQAFDSGSGRFTGIGLSNVDNRLRLYYGESHRLKVITSPGGGTCCRITIPLE